jgi:outer membrane lipoprotein-sorting protein
MKIKTIIFSLLIIGSIFGKTPNDNLTPDQVALVHKIEGFLSGMTTLRSKFLQVNPNNTTRDGVLKWKRPLKLAFEYSTKPFLFVLCNGEDFIQVDDDGKQSVAISNTPASILLKKDLDFIKNTKIKRVQKENGVIEIALASLDDPDGPSLKLIFSESPFALMRWQTTDASGQITDILFVEPQYGVSLIDADFSDANGHIKELKRNVK